MNIDIKQAYDISSAAMHIYEYCQNLTAYTQQLEDVVLENLEWWTQLRERVVKLRHQLEEEEKISRRQHV